MEERWSPRTDWPEQVVVPQHVHRKGVSGPTPGQARGPGWVRTSSGFYVPAGTDRSLVEQRIVEQAVHLPEAGAITGWAALRMAGTRYVDGTAPDGVTAYPVPLAVPASFNLSPNPDRVLLRAAYLPEEVRELHGLRCTVPVRALFDEVRRLGEIREAVVAVDMTLVAALVTLDEIDAFLAKHKGRRGIWLLQEARWLASTRSASPPETRMRLVWQLDAGLPRPQCNWPVAASGVGYLGKPDLLCPSLGVFGEFDGHEHRWRKRHQQDVGRLEKFLEAGLEGFVVVGPDLQDTALVVRRMHAAVDRAASSNRMRTWMLRSNPKPLWP